MTQRLWQKKPALSCSDDVIDIVQFGSSLEEGQDSRDIDIAVIFRKIPLKEQLTQAQAVKRQLEEGSDKPLHVMAYDYYSLFDASNFARESIMFNGRSLLTQDYLAARFGFTPRVQLHYSLIGLNKKDKIRFNYMLNGKQGQYGLLRKYGGRLLKPGLIEVAPEHGRLFLDAIKRLSQDCITKLILESSGKREQGSAREAGPLRSAPSSALPPTS